MVVYLTRRLLALLPVWVGITVLAFGLSLLTPGDPAEDYLRRVLDSEPTPEAVARVRREFGLDQPFPVQYARWVWAALHGDLGRSYRTRGPVLDQLVDRLPATFQIALPATVLGVGFALPLGALAAVWRRSWFDHASRVTALLGASMPAFWLALLLITLLSVKLRLLPVAGRGGPEHVVLPSITLALGMAAVLTRLTRSSLLEVLGEDYVRTARAKGLPERVVVARHALKGALIAVVTMIGVSFGHLLGGAAIVETIFAWPGLGRLAVESIYARDYPVIQGYVLVTGTIFVLVNLAVDLCYAWMDPRVRLGGGWRTGHAGGA